MTDTSSTVFIVEDDPSVSSAIARMLKSAGLQVKTFASAQEFLKSEIPDTPCCLLTDVCLPGLSGLDLQKELAERNHYIPIIFLTSYGDVPMSVAAIKAGAIDFLTKPYRNQDVLNAVHKALDDDVASNIGAVTSLS